MASAGTPSRCRPAGEGRPQYVRRACPEAAADTRTMPAVQADGTEQWSRRPVQSRSAAAATATAAAVRTYSLASPWTDAAGTHGVASPAPAVTRRSGADGRGRLLHECIYSEEFACRGTRTRCRLVLCFHTASVSRVAFLTLRHVLFITMHLCTSKQIKWNKEIKQHFFLSQYIFTSFFFSLALLRIRRLSIKVRDGCTDLYLYMTG